MTVNILTPFKRYFAMSEINKYLWSFLVFNIGLLLFQTVITLSVTQYFGIPGKDIGYYLGFQ